MSRLHLYVFGRVQGVGFRYACCREARSQGLTGWVRNLPDDSVEIVAEGPSAPLKAFEAWCGRGPPLAQVARLVSKPEPARGEFRSFAILDAWESQP